MKYLIGFIVLLFLLLSLSCHNRKDKEFDCFRYPSQIDSLKTKDLYDSARWILYTWLGERKDYELYYGEMELRFHDFFLRNDSLELFFRFYLPGPLPDTDIKSKGIARCSVAFNIKTRQKLWAFYLDGFSDGLEQGDPKLDNPASPEVIRFIKDHKEKLNSCFLELARKLKVSFK